MQTLTSLAVAAALGLALPAGGAEPPRRTPELLEKGKVSFARNCAACHGPKGEGDGPAASALKPPPENLVAHPPRGGAPAVFALLGRGVSGTAMGPFGHLPEEERWALAFWVEGLGARR